MQRRRNQFPFPLIEVVAPSAPRSQEVLNRLENERCAEFEVEAFRTRTAAARRLMEHHVISKARAQGRKEGYEEGLAAGRSMRVAGSDPRAVNRRLQSKSIAADSEDEEEGGSFVAPSPAQWVSPPHPHMHLPQLAMTHELKQLYTDDAYSSSRVAPASDHTSTALYAPTLPVPTLITPVTLPLPFNPAP